MGLAFYACVPSPFTSFNASLGVILCECCQVDSSDILWRGDIVLFSLFTWIVKTCVFILGTSFSWLVPRQQRLLVYTMGGITSHPSSHISAPGWDVFCGRTSHSDSSFISPFGKIRCCFVVFFRILRHASHVRWIRLSWIFHTHAVALIILGCSYYFELLSGCALMVLLAAALNPTTPHRTLPSHAGRYCARILSYRQFEYLPSWKYCVVSFSSNYQTRVFYSMVSFHVSFRHIAVARSIHGLRSLSPFTSYHWS